MPVRGIYARDQWSQTDGTNNDERGNAYIEFVLVTSFFFVPLVLGMITICIAVTRSFQVNQLTRDVGHMMANGVDFSQQKNQDLVVNDLANGLSMQSNCGKCHRRYYRQRRPGAVCLSSLTSSCGCTNAGHVVVVDRIIIGNNELYTSSFGSPATIDSNGNVQNFTSDTGARADNVSSVITVPPAGWPTWRRARSRSKIWVSIGFITNLGAFNRAVF